MFMSAGRLFASANSGPVDQYFNNVFSLMHFDGSGGSTTVTDVKGNSITVGAGCTISTAQFKFGGSSLNFNRSLTSKLGLATSAIGTQDFTIEFWAYFTQIQGSTAVDTMLDGRPPSTQGAYPTLLYDATGSITGSVGWAFSNNNTVRIASGSNTAVLNTWYHVALSRVNGVTRLFINGTQVGSNYTDATSYLASTWNIGANTFSGATNHNFGGYMDDFRLTIGVGRYSANFTIPATAYANRLGDPDFASVYALMHFDGANGATTTVDVKGHPVVVGTGCQISTAQSKFGGSSMSFTRVNTAKVSFDLAALGTQDFTIEYWVRFNSIGSADSMFDARPTGQNGPYPDIVYVNGGGGWNYFVSGGTVISGGSAVINTWYHVALCKKAGTTRLFVNGSQVGSSFTDAVNYNVATTVPLGASQNTGNGNLDGYMDDLRVTIGVGRYTSSFTPPPFAFPNN